MVAALKQLNFDSYADGADVSSLFDVRGGTVSLLASAADSVTGAGNGFVATGNLVADYGGLTYTDGSAPSVAQVLVVGSSPPPAASTFMRINNGSTLMACAVLTTGNVLQIQDSTGFVAYTSGALSAGVYWVSMGVTPSGSPTTTGHIYAFCDQLVSGAWSAVSIGSDPGAVCNVSSAAATVARFGKTSSTGNFSAHGDRPSIAQGSPSSKIDAPLVNQAPNLVAAGDITIGPWDTFTTSCIAGDPDGGTLPAGNYTCTQTGGTAVALSGTGNSRAGQAPAIAGGDVLTFLWQVTDSGGLPAGNPTADRTQTVTVRAPATFVVDTDGTWQPCRMQTL